MGNCHLVCFEKNVTNYEHKTKDAIEDILSSNSSKSPNNKN